MEFRTAIVGSKYNPGADEILTDLAEGTPVDLVREPDNRHDPNAIAVRVNGVMCGHVTKHHAATLAPDMDAGKIVTATASNAYRLVVVVSDPPVEEETQD